MPPVAAATTLETLDIVLADDHELVRTGIKALLLAIPGVKVVAEARDGEELLEVLESVRPDVVVTDISMPGLDGLAALERIRSRHPGVRVVVLSMFESAEFIKRAVSAGASAYVLKGSSAEDLEQALRAVASCGSYFSRAIARHLLEQPEPPLMDQLTGRQVEILTMMARGLSSKEIGYELGLSSKTVDAHRARIMDRLGLNDLASLTLYAVRKGLVKP